MTLTNIPISIEYSGENQGNPLVCNFATWLLVIGFGITFSALFAKTYRINKIIASAKRCRRIKLSVKDTLYPVAIIFFCTFHCIIRERFDINRRRSRILLCEWFAIRLSIL